MAANNRLLGLDALRGLAALAVVVTHLSRSFYLSHGLPLPAVSVELGPPAVALFFAISGFVYSHDA
jgi:peptidoglycan/LPS O-acetylase OafA/YrhL